jgi:hypothetical protein
MSDRYAASMSIWKAPGKLLIYVQKLNLKKDLAQILIFGVEQRILSTVVFYL